MQSNEMKKTNCLCDILPTPTFRVRHKTLRPCYTYAHERANNFFRPVNVYLFAFNHFSQFSSALTFHFQLQNLSCFSYPTTQYGTLKESVCNIVWCSSKSISYKIPSFKWTFDLHKYKICHVSVTTPLDMAL